MNEAAIRWSGVLLIGGGTLFAVAVGRVSLSPVTGQALSPSNSILLLLASGLLLVSLPGMYVRQASAAGSLGFVGFALLEAGLVLVVMVASTPILYPTLKLPTSEHPILFLLGVALVLGLILTAIATLQARVYPSWSGTLLIAATVGFLFSFFIAEFLPPITGQVGSAFFGVVLGFGLAWAGLFMWRAPVAP